MSFIELFLYPVEFKANPGEFKPQDRVRLSEAIGLSAISVVLGAPGSGKSSLLDKFAHEHDNSKRMTVRKFLESKTEPETSIDTLLLDGLDEYRSSQPSEKAYTVERLAEKISEIMKGRSLRFVIACREMDWYGETDVKSLTDEIRQPCKVYGISPLDDDQQLEIARLFEISDPATFVNKFQSTGFLRNPQMFSMMADIHGELKDGSISRKDLYTRFLMNARERNPVRIKNDEERLTSEEILLYTGYLAFMYFFAEVLELNAMILEDLQVDGNFSRAKLEKTVNTTLFTAGQFIHRTIAEFSCAWFLINFLLNKQGQSIAMIKSLFVRQNRVPTELRGIFAWLCGLTQDTGLIETDPYYQLIHADCSHFSVSGKKQIILAVKKYAKDNPYFFSFRSEGDLATFYTPGLDEFLEHELQEAFTLPNHYVYFLSFILVSAAQLSAVMRTAIKSFCMDLKIKGPHKAYLVKTISSDVESLTAILDMIGKTPALDRDDSFKDAILRLLYPESIGPDKIVDYLFWYRARVGGHCYYLFKTPLEKKLALVEAIMNIAKPDRDYRMPKIPENCKPFIYDFFSGLVSEYPEKRSAEETYAILRKFRPLFGSHMGIPFRSSRFDVIAALDMKKAQMTELANAIFALHVDEALKSDSLPETYHDYPSYVGFSPPTEIKAILLKKLDAKLDKNKLFFLLIQVYHSSTEADKDEEITALAEKYGMVVEIAGFLNPPKDSFQLEFAEDEQKRKEEQKQTITENDRALKALTDEAISDHFGYMVHIANMLFLEPPTNYRNTLSDGAFERLRNRLKAYLYRPPPDADLVNIASLVKDSPQAMRHIDRVYYVSASINGETEYAALKNNSFLRYLYVISLSNENSINVTRSGFAAWLEKERASDASAALKEFVSGLANRYAHEYSITIKDLLDKEERLSVLKELTKLYVSETSDLRNCTIANVLKQWAFMMPMETLGQMEADFTLNELQRNTATAIRNFRRENLADFTKSQAVRLYRLLDSPSIGTNLAGLQKTDKIRFVHYLMTVFKTEGDIRFHNGVQSETMECASFLRQEVWSHLDIEELRELRHLHESDGDIWLPRLLQHISEGEQKEADQSLEKVSIEKAKDFLLQRKLITEHSYFRDIVEKLNALKRDIEDNIDNQKNAFYDSDGKPRSEGFCRDLIQVMLKDRHGYTNEFIRERYVGDYRADLNIKYKLEPGWQVQIECKKDNHADLKTAINDQLIAKYLKESVKFGIYLVILFSQAKNYGNLLKEIQSTIPQEYIGQIEVILIDLRKYPDL